MLSLVVESWTWYGVVVFVAMNRFISRALLFRSIKKLQIDDWTMVSTLSIYSTFIVCINIVARNNSNLLPPGFAVGELTPGDIADREFGSKMILVVEQCQITQIWLAKACLLILYYRLTIALRENLFIKVLAGYVFFGFVFMEIFYFAVWCRPFHNYWAVPTPNVQCNAATNHLITNAVFNLSSDLAILALAMQMLIRSQLPVQKKLILSAIFGLGIFVIIAAVLNKYYSFSQPFGSMWTYWYVRESSTALLVANLPFTWTLLRRLFNLHAFDSQGASSRTNQPRQESWLQRSPVDATMFGQTSDESPSLPTWRDNQMFGRADKEALSMDGQRTQDIQNLECSEDTRSRIEHVPGERRP